MNKVTVSVFTLIVIALTASFLFITKDKDTVDSEWKEKRLEGTGQHKIVQVYVEGQIASGVFSDDIISQLNRILKDNKVKGIVLHVNSPGGDVVTSDNIYNKLVEIKNSGRKVVVSMGPIAASGGYYLAASGEQIFANPSTITGSIGVIISFTNYKGLGEMLGFKSINITSGENKALTDPLSDFSNKAEEIYQSVVEDSFEQFVNVIMEGRNMSKEQVLNIADGRVFSGKQAKEVGLIDQYGSLEDATEYLKSTLNEPDIRVVRYIKNSSVLDVMSLRSQTTYDQQFNKIKEELEGSQPKIMYMLK